jgi:hypothetical protein
MRPSAAAQLGLSLGKRFVAEAIARSCRGDTSKRSPQSPESHDRCPSQAIVPRPPAALLRSRESASDLRDPPGVEAQAGAAWLRLARVSGWERGPVPVPARPRAAGTRLSAA